MKLTKVMPKVYFIKERIGLDKYIVWTTDRDGRIFSVPAFWNGSEMINCGFNRKRLKVKKFRRSGRLQSILSRNNATYSHFHKG